MIDDDEGHHAIQPSCPRMKRRARRTGLPSDFLADVSPGAVWKADAMTLTGERAARA